METSSFGEMPLRVVSWDPPRRLRMRIRIADDTLPSGGTRTYDIAPVEAGCPPRITENGFAEPALSRLMWRFVFGCTATIESVASPSRRFGEQVAPEP